MIVTLDLSTTCTGVGFYDGSDVVKYTTITGSPLAQLAQIESVLNPLDEVVYEQHVHFRNGKVTRMLNEHNGYIAHRLRESGFAVSSLFPGKGRKQLIAHYEKLGLSKDELDAVILVNAFLKQKEPFTVERATIDECRNNCTSNR